MADRSLVCVCVHACVRACVCACMHACEYGRAGKTIRQTEAVIMWRWGHKVVAMTMCSVSCCQPDSFIGCPHRRNLQFTDKVFTLVTGKVAALDSERRSPAGPPSERALISGNSLSSSLLSHRGCTYTWPSRIGQLLVTWAGQPPSCSLDEINNVCMSVFLDVYVMYRTYLTR